MLNKVGILPIVIAALIGIGTLGVFAQDGEQPGFFDGRDDTLVAAASGGPPEADDEVVAQDVDDHDVAADAGPAEEAEDEADDEASDADEVDEVDEADEAGDENADADGDDVDDVELEECNRGPGKAGEFRLEIEDDEVKIDRGTVASFDGTTLIIVGSPGGPISAVLTAVSEIDGDLATAIEVRLKGTVLEDGNIVIDEVKVLCPEPEAEEEDEEFDHDDEADDDIDDDDDDEGEIED